MTIFGTYPDNKVNGANVGPTWGRQDPGGPHVDPMNFAIWVGCIIFIVSILVPLYRASHANKLFLHADLGLFSNYGRARTKPIIEYVAHWLHIVHWLRPYSVIYTKFMVKFYWGIFQLNNRTKIFPLTSVNYTHIYEYRYDRICIYI